MGLEGGMRRGREPGGKRGIRFHITGFDKFSNRENPTKKIVEMIQKGGLDDMAAEKSGVEIASAQVLETSAVYAQEAVAKLHQEIERADAVEGTAVVIHLGVLFGSESFHLESRGVNEASFRCPDERNYSPQQLPIVPTNGSIGHYLETSLPTEALAQCMNADGFATKESTDAGRFVCNWTYYLSLHHSRRSRAPVLFVHVPPESPTCSLEHELAYVRALLVHIADLHRSNQLPAEPVRIAEQDEVLATA